MPNRNEGVDDDRLSSLEELYNSDNIEDLISFYENLETPEDFITFSKHRARAHAEIFEANTRRDTSIVAVTCSPCLSDSITSNSIEVFNSFPMVIVQSSGSLFNFSTSMNLGIEHALKSNPQWIILLNNDITPIGDISQLQHAILNSTEADVLIPHIESPVNTNYNSNVCIYAQSWLERFVRSVMFRCIDGHVPTRFMGQFIADTLHVFKHPDVLRYLSVYENHSKVVSIIDRLFRALSILVPSFSDKILCVKNIQPISVIKSSILSDYRFDDIFINGGEDLDMSIRLERSGCRFKNLEFSFFDPIGSSLGVDLKRVYRNTLPELLYLGYKFRKVYK